MRSGYFLDPTGALSRKGLIRKMLRGRALPSFRCALDERLFVVVFHVSKLLDIEYFGPQGQRTEVRTYEDASRGNNLISLRPSLIKGQADSIADRVGMQRTQADLHDTIGRGCS